MGATASIERRLSEADQHMNEPPPAAEMDIIRSERTQPPNLASCLSESSAESSAECYVAPLRPFPQAALPVPQRVRSLTSVDQDTAIALQSVIMNLEWESRGGVVTTAADSGLAPRKATAATGEQPKELQSSVIWSTFCLAPAFAKLPETFLPIDQRIKKLLESIIPPLQNALIPIQTDGDGNCLLHAASLSMFGSHDRSGVLRKKTTELLNHGELGGLLEDAWKQDAIESDLQLKATYGIELERRRSSLQREFDATKLSGERDREFLGSFHVLALAHVLRRPIIVYVQFNP